MVERSKVPWTTLLRSNARVTWSRSRPSCRDHMPTYIDGAYCACSPAIRSSARGSGVRAPEQQLPSEQGPVQLPLGERALGGGGHARKLTLG